MTSSTKPEVHNVALPSSGQTDRQTDPLTTILCTPPGQCNESTDCSR